MRGLFPRNSCWTPGAEGDPSSSPKHPQKQPPKILGWKEAISKIPSDPHHYLPKLLKSVAMSLSGGKRTKQVAKKMAVQIKNSRSSRLLQLPMELLLLIDNFVTPTSRVLLRQTSTSLRFYLGSCPAPQSRVDLDELQMLITFDRICAQEESSHFLRWKGVRACSYCKMQHPSSYFPAKGLAQKSQGRQCTGATGDLKICPEITITHNELMERVKACRPGRTIRWSCTGGCFAPGCQLISDRDGNQTVTNLHQTYQISADDSTYLSGRKLWKAFRDFSSVNQYFCPHMRAGSTIFFLYARHNFSFPPQRIFVSCLDEHCGTYFAIYAVKGHGIFLDTSRSIPGINDDSIESRRAWAAVVHIGELNQRYGMKRNSESHASTECHNEEKTKPVLHAADIPLSPLN
ncbi:hypothetical protein EJ08DRAFT_491626 [Tothia fuscella]|uniref:F-box domain-containing protein n=1 Tax=Tothia fuscella TaxID=1048955 RepID=A0A9P4NHM6_9PEZI|nr:hypothetical protein EJ08DRAFT_491626 [Tothia fuscella]